MGFPSFYAGICVLHLVGFVFFLPREINPLPLGMKTGYIGQGLITVYAIGSAVAGTASIGGFLTLFFTIVMEVILWASIVVFGVIVKMVRGVETGWEIIDTNVDLTSSGGERVGNLARTVDDDKRRTRDPPIDTNHSRDDVQTDDGPPDPVTHKGSTSVKDVDDDISQFKKMSQGAQNKVDEMWDKAFRNN